MNIQVQRPWGRVWPGRSGSAGLDGGGPRQRGGRRRSVRTDRAGPGRGGGEVEWDPRAHCRPPRLSPLQGWLPAGRAVPAAVPAAPGRALSWMALPERPHVPDAARCRPAG